MPAAEHSSLATSSKGLRTLAAPSAQTSIPLCPSLSVALGGSAIELYQSDSFYDDLFWAAAWMYRATGATSRPPKARLLVVTLPLGRTLTLPWPGLDTAALHS